MKDTDHDELTFSNSPSFGAIQSRQALIMEGQNQVLKLLNDEAMNLKDEAFRSRALGQESVGKVKDETGKYLLSLVASLPTKLRAQ